MDILLLTLGFVCIITGLMGSFLPVIPGPSVSWIGLALLYFTNAVPANYWILGIAFLITVIISVLDYVIPAKGTKKFGGSSVADADKIRNVARIITETYRMGHDVVAVLSAQGDTTDDLIMKAAEINPKASRREMDMLLPKHLAYKREFWKDLFKNR